MAKTKRGKRNKIKKIRKTSYKYDEPRTCVSPNESIDKSQTIFNLVDLITPILTPSPNYQEFNEIFQEKSFKIGNTADSLKTPETPENGGKNSILNYRTPLKRRKSISIRSTRNLAASITHLGENISEKVPKLGENNRQIVRNDDLKRDILLSPMIHFENLRNSTPKISVANLCESPQIVHNNLSPILNESVGDYGTSNRIKGDDGFGFIPFFRVNTRRRFRFRRIPMSLFHVYSWLQAVVKKGFYSLKHLIFNQNQQQNVCKTCQNENKILNEKIMVLQTELQQIKTQLDQIETLKKEFIEFKLRNVANAHAPPPPPPPPPPLPPPLPPPFCIGPTPTSRPTKVMNRKEKQNENCRPAITVEEILKVRLKKANVSTQSTRKNPKSPSIKNEEILKQIKLRPIKKNPPHPKIHQILSSSPVSSLERMLRNVDATTRTNRRVKKSQFLSVNDVSRSPSFRYRQCNDSAPVM